MSERYDPQAVEDSPTKSEYFSKKDLKWLVLLGVVAAAVGYPLYKWGLERSHKALCSNNIKALADAMNLYAEAYDDRYPPLFDADASGAPVRVSGKAPVTWASYIRPYHNGKTSLACPSALEGEAAMTEWGGSSVPISYGFYAGHASVVRANIDDQDETILLAETSSLGAQGSFDPLPYKAPDGTLIPDAFVIAWNDSNVAPTMATKSVTRLAFRNTGDGAFGAESSARHESGIHAVTVSG
ncbi:hypothetical protein EON81_29325, partial [bacterium]